MTGSIGFRSFRSPFLPGGPLNDWEKKYVKWALVTFVVYVAFIGFLVWLHTYERL